MHADISACVNAAQSAGRTRRRHGTARSMKGGISQDAISLRKWHRLSCVDEVMSQFHPIWKLMIVILRHAFSLRAQDESVHWNTQMPKRQRIS